MGVEIRYGCFTGVLFFNASWYYTTIGHSCPIFEVVQNLDTLGAVEFRCRKKRSESMPQPQASKSKKFYRTLYFRVIVGILLGVALGVVAPSTAGQMEPLGTGFIKLIRMMIGPIIFFTVVVGIASIGDMRKLGRVGVKALLYFEVVTSLALLIGLLVVNVIQPGVGMNVDASKLDTKAIQGFAAQGHSLKTVDFLMNIIPRTFIGAFAEGDILQVLFLAILVGLALAALGQGKSLVAGCDKIAHLMFGVIGLIMQAAPLGAFGAMAYTVGHYGLKTLIPLAKLMACVYITSISFVFVVLGAIAMFHGFSVWKFIKYIKEELLIVLGTSSSESVLPRIMVKMEALGCSKSVVGLVIPSGYSFNLDGTSIYLTIAAIFVAQATNTHLTLGQEAFLLASVILPAVHGLVTAFAGKFMEGAASASGKATVEALKERIARSLSSEANPVLSEQTIADLDARLARRAKELGQAASSYEDVIRYLRNNPKMLL